MAISIEQRLRLSLIDRTEAFQEQVERELARVGSTGPGLRHALELFMHYASTLRLEVDQAWDDAPNSAIQRAEMQSLILHLRQRVEFFDTRFSRGHLLVPNALTTAVERECQRMGLAEREAVLSVGPPGNFVTFIANLRQVLFRDLQVIAKLPTTVEKAELVLIAVPQLEGTRASWQPVVIGHELGHYLQSKKPLNTTMTLVQALDLQVLGSTTGSLPGPLSPGTPRARALEQIALRWLNELLCDAYAVHKFGAAAVAALSEFLDSVGAGTVAGSTHPPANLRTTLMLRWLGEDLDDVEEDIVAPFRALSGTPSHPDWAEYMGRIFLQLSGEIESQVGQWSGELSYHKLQRSDIVEYLAEQLDRGVPSSEANLSGRERSLVDSSDILNACWLSVHRGTAKPVNRLALKALDTVDFLTTWAGVGGSTEPDAVDPVEDTPTPGALAEGEIRRRLSSGTNGELSITPLLPNSVRGASVDLRLGNKFIVFERSSAATFDALSSSQDPRSMQSFTERAWGDVFYLHPGQLVLAATLEYLVMPNDLTAQVITRSSYGRLGLLSATAVQVHPCFAGCLTLELVNLGEMPMTITPGERVAQLLLLTTSEPYVPVSADEKYRYPTGPEFSKIRHDPESRVLQLIRSRFQERRRER